MPLMLALVLAVALAVRAAPVYAGLGTSPTLTLSVTSILWRSADPITLYAGIGTSPSKVGESSVPVQSATLEFYLDGILIDTGVTDADGNVSISIDASALLPGTYTVEVRFAGGCFGEVCYEPSTTTQVLHVEGTFTFLGFRPPVAMEGLNTVNAGQTIPIKWRLGDPDGNPVRSLLAVKELQAGTFDCADGIENEIAETDTSGSSGLRYDSENEQYIHTFQTEKAWSGICRRFVLSLSDDSIYSADFRFR